MSNAKRRHRRRYRKTRSAVVYVPASGVPISELFKPEPPRRDFYRLGNKGKTLRDSYVIRMGKS